MDIEEHLNSNLETNFFSCIVEQKPSIPLLLAEAAESRSSQHLKGHRVHISIWTENEPENKIKN